MNIESDIAESLALEETKQALQALQQQQEMIDSSRTAYPHPPIPQYTALVEELGTYAIDGTYPTLVSLRDSIPELIRELEQYTEQLRTYLDNIGSRRIALRQFEFAPNFSEEADSVIGELDALSERVIDEIRTNAELICTARNEESIIHEELFRRTGHGSKIEAISTFNRRIELFSSEVRTAIERHRAEVSRFSSKLVPARDLQSLKETAKARRDFIMSVYGRLNNYLTGASNELPIIGDLTYDITDAVKIQEIDTIIASTKTALKASTQSQSMLSKMTASIFGKNPIQALRDIVSEKMAQLNAELSVTDISVPPAAGAPRSHVWHNLIELQHAYQTRLAFDAEKSHIELLGLSVKQAAMKHQQANLQLLLTRLEYNLEEITPKLNMLAQALSAICDMTTDEALETLVQHKERIAAVTAWLNSSSATTTQRTTKQLFTELDTSFTDINRSYSELCSLHDAQAQEVPIELSDVMSGLRDKAEFINQQHLKLTLIIDTLATQKSTRELEKLTDMVAAMDALLSRSPAARNEQQALASDIDQTLASIQHENTFIAELKSRASPDSPVARQLQLIQEKQQALIDNRTALRQLDRYHQIKQEFFGNNHEPHKIGGVFGDYLVERSNTYVLRDFFEYCVSCLFSCLGYKTEYAKREKYISDLKSIAHSDNTNQHATLHQSIDSGLRLFSSCREGNGLSLQDKLRTLQGRVRELPLP